MNPEVRRHRAPPGRVALAGSRLGVAAMIVAAIAVGGLVKNASPGTDRRERPFTRTGTVGEAVDARMFDVTVVGVRGAAKISRSGKVRDTGGVWVLVKVRVVARDEPTIVAYAAVRDGKGRTYKATERLNQPLTGGRNLQPGLPVLGEIAFEVPKDVDDLVILVGPTSIDHRMDAMAEIHLDVDRAKIQEWAGDTTTMPMADVVNA